MLRTCRVCNKSFRTYPSRIRIGKGKYCGKKCAEVSLFPKGHIPWSKGKKGIHYSPATEFKKGQASWNKGKICPSMRGSRPRKEGYKAWNYGLKGFMAGDKHWNWKGGIREIRKKLHETYEYRKWRLAVLKRDNRTCQICGSRKLLEVDHIKRWKEHPELRHEVSNGRTLCRPCHMQTPTYGNYRHGRYLGKSRREPRKCDSCEVNATWKFADNVFLCEEHCDLRKGSEDNCPPAFPIITKNFLVTECAAVLCP